MLYVLTSVNDVGLLQRLYKDQLSNSRTPHKFLRTDGTVSYDRFQPSPEDVVLILGKQGIAYLQQHNMCRQGNVSMHSVRGKMYEPAGYRTIVSYDPFIASMDPNRIPDLQADMSLAIRVHSTGTTKPVTGDYREVKHFKDCISQIVYAELAERKIVISFDLETLGLDPYHKGDDERPPARICYVCITYEDERSDVLKVPDNGMPNKEVLWQIKRIVTSDAVKLVGANLKFDYGWMAHHWGIHISNQTFDTTIVGSMVNENRNNSLNLHAKIYTTMGGYDDEFNKAYDKGRFDLIPAEEAVQYGGGDTDATKRVYIPLKRELLENRRLTHLYHHLVQPASMAFARMEHRGVLVDQERYDSLEKEVKNHIQEKTKEITDLFPSRIVHAYKDDFKLSRPVILKEFLFSERGLNLKPTMRTEKTEEPSVTVEHFEDLQNHYPDCAELHIFVDAMKELRSSQKTLQTYIDGFRKHIRSDGKFHPSYMLYKGAYADSGNSEDSSGTITGRTACKDPAYQTIPKHTIWAKPLRSVYIPPPGMAILKLDFSQGELRVVACVASEQTMLSAYIGGMDLHSLTAASLNNMSLETFMSQPEEWREKKRFGGKAGNFGLLYGMQAPGFMAYARNSYGVLLSLGESRDFREKFFAQYPGLLTYHNTYHDMARKQGYVDNPLGRRRNLPLINSRNSGLRSTAERQAINSPIQSTLSDMTLMAMVELDRQYPDLWMFGNTHDELQFYVPQDDVEEWAIKIRDVMQNLPFQKFGWNPQLEFVADAEYSTVNLAECKELKLAA